ncbi:MAG TPA: Ig-like domain-containing protein [Actinomycetota bacterium]|nr:Ig-like domain-containing protein [Actinomycetota bacterium]
MGAGGITAEGGRRRGIAPLAVAAAVTLILMSPAALAGWSAASGGNAGAGSGAVAAGNAPVATLSGTTVALTWQSSTTTVGPAPEYTVRRYDTAGLQQPIVSGSCAAPGGATSCSETAVPPGTWTYSITPSLGSWSGAESPRTQIVVGAPSLTLGPSPTRSGKTLTGTIQSFTSGSILRFRLGSPSGTELQGTAGGATTPAAVPLGGSASVTVDLPTGIAQGTQAIYAVVDLTGENAHATVVVDDTPPPAPLIGSTPANPSASPDATFTFSSSETGVSFDCRLDGTAFGSCSTPMSFSGLGDGLHVFEVRAVDAAGNRSDATAYTWTIDTDAPAVAIAFPANGGSYNDSKFTAGCGTTNTGDLCGTAGTGATEVLVSIRTSGGTYWNGSAFASATEVLLTASGTTSWSFPFAASNLPEGSYVVRAVARDAAGNTGSSSSSFTIDRTRPSGVDVQTANASGGTVGRAESGDTITFTYSEPLDPDSILAGWDGNPVDVTVRINHRVTLLLVPETDVLQVWNAVNNAQLPLGSVDLGGTDYVSSDVTFGASGTRARMAASDNTITVALGTPSNSGAVTTALLSGTMSWSPSAAARDLAGNGSFTSVVTESGNSDREF